LQDPRMQDPRGDFLNSLPTNNVQPSTTEMSVIEKLFETHKDTAKNVVKDFKNEFIVGIVVFALLLPQTDALLLKYVPYTQKSPYILMILKVLIFVLLSWLIRNFWLLKE